MKIEGSQSVISKDAKKYKHAVANFVYILFGMILLFGGLIIYRITQVSIVQHAHYKNIVENTRYTSNVLAPRGKIFDRNGNLLVTNEEEIIVQYYPVKGMNDEEKWTLAKTFAKRFQVDEPLTLREEKDLYIYLHRKTIFKDRFSKEELKKYSSSELDKLLLEKIDEKDLATLTAEEKQGFRVKIAMDFATSSRLSFVKRGISKEDAAYLVENKQLYPGFLVEFDWKRKYIEPDFFKSVLGRISTEKQGLPIEESKYLTALGYQLNERVGIAGLEKQYETYLRGEPNVIEVSVDKHGNVSKNYVKEGQNGSDIYLTIDRDFQKELNKILAAQLQVQKSQSKKLQHAMVSVMDVNTGELLGMASQTLNEKDNKQSSYEDSSLAYLYGFTPGSSVKGATIYMGLSTNVVKPGEIILDAPLYILGTPVKKSYNNYGLIDELKALQVSSNVYMFHIVMRMGNAQYVPNQTLALDSEIIHKIRKYFTSFGLGGLTGLDVPNESYSFEGSASNISNALDYVIGQYDQYTLIQLNQYVNTIATRGVKLKPNLVKKIMNKDQVQLATQKEILGYVPGDHKYFDNVIEGFSRTGVVFKNERVPTKTGTSDVEESHVTNTIVSFFPKENPKISVACAVPYAGAAGLYNNENPCKTILQKVYSAYDRIFNKSTAK